MRTTPITFAILNIPKLIILISIIIDAKPFHGPNRNPGTRAEESRTTNGLGFRFMYSLGFRGLRFRVSDSFRRQVHVK